MNLVKKIKQIRIKNGLTQEEFVKTLGYKSKSTINKIEQGINVISYDKLIDLLNKYNEDLDYIFVEDSKLHINPKSSKSRLFISFSSRDEGNSFDIIKKYLNENDDYILFKNINYRSCSKCNYECMKNECKYRFDDIYKLYDLMCKYKKNIFNNSNVWVGIQAHYILYLMREVKIILCIMIIMKK